MDREEKVIDGKLHWIGAHTSEEFRASDEYWIEYTAKELTKKIATLQGKEEMAMEKVYNVSFDLTATKFKILITALEAYNDTGHQSDRYQSPELKELCESVFNSVKESVEA